MALISEEVTQLYPSLLSDGDLDRPLVVDLDGTLFKTDMAWESMLKSCKKSPFQFVKSFGTLMMGRNHFKRILADQTEICPAMYRVSEDVLQFLRRQKSAGRRLILATGATEGVTKAVLRAYPLFDEVLASSAQVNLVGSRKGAELERRFGKRGFDYIGNALADLRVWSKCCIAYFTNANLITKMALHFTHSRCVEVGKKSFRTSVKTFLKALRVHHWTKNILIVLPFLAAHRPIDSSSVIQLLLGILAFSLVASMGYLINDLVDIENDRNHSTKQRRPIAAGDLSIPNALLATFLLGSAGLYLAWCLVPLFALTVAIYFAITCAYSFWLKKTIVLDVIALTVLYTMRVIAGGYLVNVKLSNWFFVFSVFFFLSLALVKRCAELWKIKGKDAQAVEGRGYTSSDYPQLCIFGTISGFMSVLVYCLYIASPDVSVMYSKPIWLWFGLPIFLYWICRVWFLTSRGQIHEDPVIFTLTDRHSYVVGALMGIVIYAAS